MEYFPIQLGMESSSQVTNSYFSEDLKPPTRKRLKSVRMVLEPLRWVLTAGERSNQSKSLCFEWAWWNPSQNLEVLHGFTIICHFPSKIAMNCTHCERCKRRQKKCKRSHLTILNHHLLHKDCRKRISLTSIVPSLLVHRPHDIPWCSHYFLWQVSLQLPTQLLSFTIESISNHSIVGDIVGGISYYEILWVNIPLLVKKSPSFPHHPYHGI